MVTDLVTVLISTKTKIARLENQQKMIDMTTDMLVIDQINESMRTETLIRRLTPEKNCGNGWSFYYASFCSRYSHIGSAEK